MATSTTYLERTFAAGDRRKWTWSAWVKRANLGSNNWLFHTYLATSNECSIFFTPDDQFAFSIYTGNNDNGRLTTTRKFRDTNAWYHLQCVWDTANSTAGDRMKMYVNGVEETSFATDTNPPLNYESIFNSGINHTIGQYGNNDAGMRFSGCISHMHFSDGYALAPTVFGSTDSTTGEWQINASPSFTLGTNGFTILKDGNTITDQSSNSNDFSLGGGTLTKTEDCPSNNFATFNPLFPQVNTGTSKGNTRFETTSGSGWRTMCGTLGMEKNTGKYYMEFKHLGGTNNGYGIADYTTGGVVDKINRSISTYAGNNANSYGYLSQGEFFYNGSYTASGWNSYTTNDIIGMAVDMENMKLYFHKNGTYENSGNPTAGTGGYTIADPVGAYLPVVSVNSAILCANFGNGYFETTAVSSAGTNASGNGIFEYDVPSGFTALSTKGLNL